MALPQSGVQSEQPHHAHAVLTPDSQQTIKDGYYRLSYNRNWEPVGNDPAEAVHLPMTKRSELLTIANGGTVVQEPEAEPKAAGTLLFVSGLGTALAASHDPSNPSLNDPLQFSVETNEHCAMVNPAQTSRSLGTTKVIPLNAAIQVLTCQRA